MEQALGAELSRGGKARPFWIAGPCVIENRTVLSEVARALCTQRDTHGTPFVFKASFDKANRTSHRSARGPGLKDGLRELAWVKAEFGLPILTDVHEISQVGAVAEVTDIIQIPAFLCRQTDLIEMACRTGRIVNVKKGQFLSPAGVGALVAKLRAFGAKDFWITERGASFGYQRLVVDFAAFPEMERLGAPLVMDITHSVQLMSGDGQSSGGVREAIPYLARAAAGVGVFGFFAETHPNPPVSLSDSENAWPLAQLPELVKSVMRIARSSHGE